MSGLTLENGTVICLETSADKHQSTLPNVPEEQGSHSDLCGSLKSRKISSESISNSITEPCFYNMEQFHNGCYVKTRKVFLVNKINRCTEIQFYWYYYSTCLGQAFCPSSGVLSRTSVLVLIMQLWPFSTMSSTPGSKQSQMLKV